MLISESSSQDLWEDIAYYCVIAGALPWIILIAAFAVRLRRYAHNDAFGIRRELSRTAWVLFAAVCAFVVIRVTTSANHDLGWLLGTLVFCCVGVAMLAIASVAPIVQSYRFQTMSRRMRREIHRMTLQQVLNIPEGVGVEALMRFLTTEFCSESLLFWRRVNDFKALLLAQPGSPNTAGSNGNNGSNGSNDNTANGQTAVGSAAAYAVVNLAEDVHAEAVATAAAPRPVDASEFRERILSGLRDAHSIYETYLRAKSVFEVNIRFAAACSRCFTLTRSFG